MFNIKCFRLPPTRCTQFFFSPSTLGPVILYFTIRVPVLSSQLLLMANVWPCQTWFCWRSWWNRKKELCVLKCVFQHLIKPHTNFRTLSSSSISAAVRSRCSNWPVHLTAWRLCPFLFCFWSKFFPWFNLLMAEKESIKGKNKVGPKSTVDTMSVICGCLFSHRPFSSHSSYLTSWYFVMCGLQQYSKYNNHGRQNDCYEFTSLVGEDVIPLWTAK